MLKILPLTMQYSKEVWVKTDPVKMWNMFTEEEYYIL